MAFNKIMSFWDGLPPRTKQKVFFYLGLAVVVVVASAGYYMHKSSAPPPKQAAEKKDDVALDPKLLEKSTYMEGQKEIAKRDEKIAELSKQIDDIVKEKNNKDEKSETDKGQKSPQREPAPSNTRRSTGKNAELPDTPLPPRPVGNGRNASRAYGAYPPPSEAGQGYQPASNGAAVPAKPDVYGDIEIVSAHDSRPEKDGKGEKNSKEGDKKKESSDQIYLPPSFMAATLLSGLDAPTSEGAKGNPAPVFIRIKDLAVLPNRVKANLKGCFVIAEGHGNLATERAELRLVSLSCLDKRDHAVIDQKIKGFVVDSDGKIGLKGTVVSKMGAAIARSLIAGFVGGVGDAFRQSSATQSISALGATQIVDPHQVVRAGVGGGISTAAGELQKFYLELAKQTMPVIEVGATKNITIIISEGVELSIKELRRGKAGRKYEEI